mgnify:CR=1 FL=1
MVGSSLVGPGSYFLEGLGLLLSALLAFLLPLVGLLFLILGLAYIIWGEIDEARNKRQAQPQQGAKR